VVDRQLTSSPQRFCPVPADSVINAARPAATDIGALGPYKLSCGPAAKPLQLRRAAKRPLLPPPPLAARPHLAAARPLLLRPRVPPAPAHRRCTSRSGHRCCGSIRAPTPPVRQAAAPMLPGRCCPLPAASLPPPRQPGPPAPPRQAADWHRAPARPPPVPRRIALVLEPAADAPMPLNPDSFCQSTRPTSNATCTAARPSIRASHPTLRLRHTLPVYQC
jgi:hypothetical protein